MHVHVHVHAHGLSDTHMNSITLHVHPAIHSTYIVNFVHGPRYVYIHVHCMHVILVMMLRSLLHYP